MPVLEPSHVVDPRAGGIDDHSCAHRHDLAVGLDLGPRDPTARGDERNHSGAVQHRRPRVGRRHDVLETEPRVVRPRVGVERARLQAVAPQRRNEPIGALGLHEPVEPRARKGRVEEDAALHDPRPKRAPTVERQQERKPMDEVRRDRPGQRASLVVRLADEPHVAETEVAQPAVDELRGGTRGARAEVARVDERDREALTRRVCGRGGPDHAAADDEEVERRPRERVARRLPGQSGLVHAVRPELMGRRGFAGARPRCPRRR